MPPPLTSKPSVLQKWPIKLYKIYSGNTEPVDLPGNFPSNQESGGGLLAFVRAPSLCSTIGSDLRLQAFYHRSQHALIRWRENSLYSYKKCESNFKNHCICPSKYLPNIGYKDTSGGSKEFEKFSGDAYKLVSYGQINYKFSQK